MFLVKKERKEKVDMLKSLNNSWVVIMVALI